MLCNTICTMKGCRFSGGLFPSLDERGESMQHEIMKAIPLLDENGNLTSSTFLFEGEEMPASTYSYKAIEVDYERAQYILELQKYLLSVV